MIEKIKEMQGNIQNMQSNQSQFTAENMGKTKGYDDIVKVLDRANTTLISPKKIAYLGGFVLDLEESLEETLSMEVSNKTVEAGPDISENAVEKLAVVQIRGIIADYAFIQSKNIFDTAGDLFGNFGKRLQMLDAFYLDKLWPEHSKHIAKAQLIVNKSEHMFEFFKGIASFKNEIISNDTIGSPISRSQRSIAMLKAIYTSKVAFEFACEFAYYPQMMITNLKITRQNKEKEIGSGIFKVDITLHEVRSVETEVTSVEESQFAFDDSRNSQQALAPVYSGYQQTNKISISELNRRV
jgi:hypothetical protein